MKKSLILIAFIFSASLYSQSELENMSFLEGTWKVENKDQFESWSITENGKLEGYAYNMKDGQNSITETLSISKENDEVIYKATVTNQNDGQTIAFILNNNITGALSFENISHDFPKKIIYTKLNDVEIKVSVLGDNDKGFSYKMLKQ